MDYGQDRKLHLGLDLHCQLSILHLSIAKQGFAKRGNGMQEQQNEMLKGIILKGIGGFYYVKHEDSIYECKARGIFKKRKITPLVGDRVSISIQSEEEKLGVIEEIHPRKLEMIRPSVANVDQAVIVFSVKSPDPNI